MLSLPDRKMVYMMALIIPMIGAILSPVMTISPASTMTVSPGFLFYNTATSGPIQFKSATSLYGWSFASSRIRFEQIGPWSYVGFACSSNAQVTINSVNDETIEYTVTAAVLQTSTTNIELPSGGKVYKVTGADSWAFTDQVLEVKVLHASSESIIAYVNPVSSPFFTFKLMWSQMFLLVAIMWMIVEINSASQGESSGSWGRVIGWAILSAVVYVLLNTVEDLV